MSGLRERRVSLGLTQAQVASLAGVSRQLVAAVEAERNVPAVDAALKLASALQTSVEALFHVPRHAEVTAALGEPMRTGTTVRLGRIGDRLVASELPAGDGDMWATPDAVLRGEGEAELFADSVPADLVIAGCDPALGVAEALLPRPHRMLAISAPTGTALRALADETVHAAVIHGPAGQLPVPPVPVLRWHLARWNVGLATAPSLGSTPSLEAVTQSSTPLLRRERAASSQQALLRACRRARLGPLPAGPTAKAHMQAARIASERNWSALTIEAAARSYGLAFTALEEHTVEIWIAERWRDSTAVSRLGELLAGPAFVERVAHFGGYDLADCGKLVA